MHPAVLPTTDGSEPVLRIGTRRTTKLLWLATATVYGLGCLRQIYVLAFGADTSLGNMRFLDLNDELTLPAWYSSALLLAAAFLLAVHAAAARNRGSPSRSWWSLSAIFAYLSLDEASLIHERGMDLLPNTFTGFFKLSWVIIAAPILVVVGLAYIPFLRRLPPRYAWRFILAGVVYVGGALGMEMVGGYLSSTRGMGKATYLAITIEEGMEMAGACLFISALMSLLAREAPVLTLRNE
ncbi:hypothetical protein BH10PSE9_BH10PSE9_10050 [soil metagenome]